MNQERNQENKRLVHDFWDALEETPSASASAVCSRAMTQSTAWHGFDPLGEGTGADSFAEKFWIPFREAFSAPRRECLLFFGGRSSGRRDGGEDGRMWVCGTGHFHGEFQNDWLGIPASGGEVRLRWGEFFQVENGQIRRVHFLIDLVDLLQQCGHTVLPPDRGMPGQWPPPHGDDGVLMSPQDAAESTRTLNLIRKFIFDGLNTYDQEHLESMGVADYFHPNVRWYGPGGIGACQNLAEFEDLHQRHWLHAFPDREVQDLDCLFAEGQYTGASGWAGVKATHRGAYLDCPATGRNITVNGLDFWRRRGDQFIENWVFVDMIHLFRQFGVDLMGRIA